MIMEAKVDLFNCGLSLLAMQVTYLLSGYYTVMAHATLFTNLTPFMLVILRFFMRQEIHRLEIIGTFVALLGCIITV
jgi:drug/metabolite transporter (DMT)-like permease